MRKKIRIRPGAVLGGLFLAAASFLIFGMLWGLTTWGDLDVDEIIFQLQNPLQGTEKGILIGYFVKGILPIFLVLILYTAVLCRLRSRKARAGWILGCVLVSCAALFAVGQKAWVRLDFGKWLEGRKTGSEFIEAHYADPASVKMTFPEKKRNLVYLYLESMEVTSADRESGGAFSENVIPELTKIAQENEDFSGHDGKLNGGLVYSGATFTTGAMFAQTMGLPLKIEIGGNNMDTQDSFFPDITGLGDVLEDAGYRQVFLLGSNATFGGRRLLYKDHGNFEIRDYDYARERGWIPGDYQVWWGFEDEKLFSFAKETLTELAEGKEPFHLTLLTVDGHAQDGYVCPLCRDDFGDNQYANVMACTNRQAADFIDWLKGQDFYDNTTVIISGDHPTMDRDYCSEVDQAYQRKTYTAVLNSAVEPEEKGRRRSFGTMDLFPTTLAAMGVKIEGDRLGLGTNLFSKKDTLTEEYGDETFREELNRRSDFLADLEKTDESSKALIKRYRKQMKESLTIESVDAEAGQVRILLRTGFNQTIFIEKMEALYREDGKEDYDRLTLTPDPENPDTVFSGTLDVSGWSKLKGSVRIDMTVQGGQKFEDIVSAKIRE